MAAIPKVEQGKRWVFTINNPDIGTPLFTELPEKVEYIVWQLEKGPEEETPHYQGFIRCAVNFRRPRLEKLLGGRAYLALARGNDEQNRQYCSKEGRIQGPWELGELRSNNQGKRNDLPEFAEWADKVVAGLPLSQVPARHLASHAAGFKLCQSLQKSPAIRDVEVICIQGPTGIGKTHWVFENYPDTLRVSYGNSGPWFQGYDGQKSILIDEYKGQFRLQTLLQVLDKYPFQVEQKGTSCWALWTKVFITCNSTPEEWYHECSTRFPLEFQALLRRIGRCDMSMYPETKSHWISAQTREDLRSQLEPFVPIQQAEQVAIAAVDEVLNEDAPQAQDLVQPLPVLPVQEEGNPCAKWWEMWFDKDPAEMETDTTNPHDAGTIPVYSPSPELI